MCWTVGQLLQGDAMGRLETVKNNQNNIDHLQSMSNPSTRSTTPLSRAFPNSAIPIMGAAAPFFVHALVHKMRCHCDASLWQHNTAIKNLGIPQMDSRVMMPWSWRSPPFSNHMWFRPNSFLLSRACQEMILQTEVHDTHVHGNSGSQGSQGTMIPVFVLTSWMPHIPIYVAVTIIKPSPSPIHQW